jgi:hypothetical protein
MTEGTEDRAQHTAPVDAIFPRFFKEGDEHQPKLLGMIAYGLYEEARREWVDTFKGREGRYPTQEELRAYETSWTSSRLEGLKNAAVQILASYADSISREIENQTLRRALRGGFLRSVVRWLFSAVLFVAAVLGGIVALSRAGIDPVDSYRALLRPTDSFAGPPAVTTPVTPVPSSPSPSPAADLPAAVDTASPSPTTNAPVPPARRPGR